MAIRPRKMMVLVCRGSECGDKRNSAAIHARFAAALAAHGDKNVSLKWQSCFGQCQKGVNVMVRELRPGEDAFFLSFVPSPGRGAVLYNGVEERDVQSIVTEHVIAGREVTELKRRGQ